MKLWKSNEGRAILLALLFALGAWGYKTQMRHRLETAETTASKTLREIRETRALKTLWRADEVTRSLRALRRNLPPKTIKTYTVRTRKATLHLVGMDGRTLNRTLRSLGRLPLRLRTLSVKRDGTRYEMECRCKW